MTVNKSDWCRLAPDMIALIGMHVTIFAVLIFVTVVIPAIKAIEIRTKQGDPSLFYLAASAGAIGIVFLFLARLPLYRKRKLLSFGPYELIGIHRKLYFAAYPFIVASVILLLWLLGILK